MLSTESNQSQLIEKFGVTPITPELVKRFERVTGHKVHPWITRGIFFAHRDLNKILDDYEQKKPIFIYTGRGPSSNSLHLGHLVPFMFTKWLQDVFNAVVIIQLAGDEKYFFKNISRKDIHEFGINNAKDIIAIGFNPKKTYIFFNRDEMTKPSYINVFSDILKNICIKKVFNTFGITPEDNSGKLVSTIYQTTAAFSESFNDIFKGRKVRCLVAYAIDQDPYFRMARHVAPKIKSLKPCSLIANFLPSLTGSEKMSSTTTKPDSRNPSTTIFLTLTKKQVKKLINKHAFSGGQQTLELHRKLGANLQVDMTYQYLRFFELDDNTLNHIAKEYGSGRMLSGEIKKILINKINEIITDHITQRAKITPKILEQFFSSKNIDL